MKVLVDTGPLVGLLDVSDGHHDWARRVFKQLRRPLVTTEAVVAETLFLCRRGRIDPSALLSLLDGGSLRLEAFDIRRVVSLLSTYADVPMSLADAGLLALHEKTPGSFVVTCDSDFAIYRRRGNRPVEALMPTTE